MGLVIEKVAFDSPRGREAWAVRVEVFVREQGVPVELEHDAYDAEAVHLVAVEDQAVIGTLRIVRMDVETVKIGRVAVRKTKRKGGVGRAMMVMALKEIDEMGVRRAVLTSQTAVIGFYEKLGFVAEGPVFDEAGIPHRKMTFRVRDGSTRAGPILAYAAKMAPQLEASCLRSGDLLVTARSARLPELCVLCGERAAGAAVERKFDPRKSFQLSLERQSVELSYFYCRRHRRIIHAASTMRWVLAGIILAMLMFAAMVRWNGLRLWGPELATTCVLMACALGLVIGVLAVIMTRGPVFHSKRGGLYYFKGVSPLFLATLPELDPLRPLQHSCGEEEAV